MNTTPASNLPTLVGRSSSHFTRLARIFAEEHGIRCSFRAVADLRSLNADDYGTNPALKIPILLTSEGNWFGSLNICRQFARLSPEPLRIVWPEHAETPLLANAQELVAQGMATEVSWLMGKLGGAAEGSLTQQKAQMSLVNSLEWLEKNLSQALAELPREYDLSYFEAALFCFVEHLEFREVLSVAPYAALLALRARFANRPSASLTAYRFDS